MAKKKSGRWAKNIENLNQGISKLKSFPLFESIYQTSAVLSLTDDIVPNSWCQITQVYEEGALHSYQLRDATLIPNYKRNLTPDEWSYVIALALLHVALNHIRPDRTENAWRYACAIYVQHFIKSTKVGSIPAEFPIVDSTSLPLKDEEALYAYFKREGIAPMFSICELGGDSVTWMIESTSEKIPIPHAEKRSAAFVSGLRRSVRKAIKGIAEAREVNELSVPAKRALSWVISSFPLLSALASTFKIIEEADVCDAQHIEIAAVNSELREIYIHPRWEFSTEELRFIFAHEFLHVGLRHEIRCQGRDPYLWNVACDYVVNGWLMEMQVGSMPSRGILYDKDLAGSSAEEVYDRITRDLRWQRKLKKIQTLGGVGRPDMVGQATAKWWTRGEGMDLDAFYRRALLEGERWYSDRGRGFLPAGLVEEIRALNQPPIPWDVELAQWMDQFFPTIEKRRTYARMSRRQSATPDIARPYWYRPEENRQMRTFGVVLDTSASMTRKELAMAIGAIASFALSREVAAIRLVYCDARPYDAGYILSESLLQQVEIKGRGGTRLQPAIDLLENAEDFPEKAPILIITDGAIDVLSISSEHAFLLARGARLPFRTKAPIFYFQ